MAFKSPDFSSTLLPPATTHHHISSRFPDPLDCLAAHLMLECSEVLGGVKPANLVSLTNRTRSCGRNLYQLWLDHKETLFTRIGGMSIHILQTKPSSVLLFCYDRSNLTRHLSHSGIRALLSKSGYDASVSCDDLLCELFQRFAASSSFPHEIGLFIGYPAKDVAAFMGLIDIPFTCQGPWKIYGNPHNSLCLADTYRKTRAEMGCKLSQCSSPFVCISALECGTAFF